MHIEGANCVVVLPVELSRLLGDLSNSKWIKKENKCRALQIVNKNRERNINDALSDKNVWFAAHLKSFETASTTQLKYKGAKKVVLKLLDVYNKALAANSKKDIIINKSRDLMEGAAKYLALPATEMYAFQILLPELKPCRGKNRIRVLLPQFLRYHKGSVV